MLVERHGVRIAALGVENGRARDEDIRRWDALRAEGPFADALRLAQERLSPGLLILLAHQARQGHLLIGNRRVIRAQRFLPQTERALNGRFSLGVPAFALIEHGQITQRGGGPSVIGASFRNLFRFPRGIQR